MKHLPVTSHYASKRYPSTFALYSLLIPYIVDPVEDGDGGLNIQARDDQPDGMLAIVDPWWGMAAGDHVDIFWGSETNAVAQCDVGPDDIDQRLFFFLDISLMKPGWVESIYYRLTRTGSTTPEDSLPLRILIKLDRPGGVDKDPHLPGHSELAIPGLPQEVIDNGVDQKWAGKGIPVEIAAYPNRAPRDTIDLRWGNIPLRHRVTAAEAAGTASIVINVDYATIIAAGDSAALVLKYQVFDEVFNYSVPWSLQTSVPVDADTALLEQPFIKEANSAGIIDLGLLGSSDVTVQIEARPPTFSAGDTVTLTWVGTPLVGDPLIYTQAQVLDNVPSIFEIKVPNAHIRALKDGSVQATYVLSKAVGEPQSSKRAFAKVSGQIPLPAPEVLEAVGNTLDPTLERAHAVIPVYEAMASGDLIDLFWRGIRQNGTPHTYEAQHIVTSNEVGEVIYIGVPEEDIAILASGMVDVSYRVSNDARPPANVRVSDALPLIVAQRYAELPAPTVAEAPDGVLDPESVPVHATLWVPYTGMAAGDYLTWYWRAETPDGTFEDSIPITHPIAGKPISFYIPRSLIEPSMNTLVKIFYSVRLAGTHTYRYSQVLDLTIGKLIGELPPPQVLEANGTTLNPMQALNGATVRVRYASMVPEDIVTLIWLGTPGAGSPSDQQRPGSASGEIDFQIPATVIGANIGRQVSVVYLVRRYVAQRQSAYLTLDVIAIPDSQLPTPTITQANAQTRVLNLATFAGNATTTVAPWPFLATGQRVWLRLEGETESSGPHSIVLLDGAELTGAQVGVGLSETVRRTELEKLGQDTTLRVVCKVAFNGLLDEPGALPFPLTTYEFKLHHEWLTPIIVSVRDSSGEVAEGGTTFEVNLTLSGTGTIDTELEILDGTNRITTTRTDMNGVWTTELTNQHPKGYSITAKALDGSGLASSPRTYQVLANLTPRIEEVLDTRGSVPNNGTTVDTTLTVRGNASPDQRIELFDGTASIGEVATDFLGAWTRPASGLTVGAHSFKARALYGTRPESMAWTVIVAQAVAPTISSIRENDGDEIAPDGFTVDTSVILTGNANANLEVEIFDGSLSEGKVRVSASGVWTLPLNNVSVAAHSITAKALYGAGASSAPRRFTVVATVNPTLTAVVDPQGAPVPVGSSTYANTVTASGQAAIYQQVEVFDGANSKGTATANASGAWSRAVTGLQAGARSLTAKALYANNPVSAPWGFTVKLATVPTLVSVRDSRAEIGNGGATTETSVTASGKAAPNEQVQVYDGATPKGNASVNGSGDWSQVVSGLALGAHRLKAVAKYGTEPVSNERTFTVKSPIPDFVLDRSNVNLNGKVYVLAGYPNLDPAPWPSGTTYTRRPSSGVAPYIYSSSNPAVVKVDGNGTIYSCGNGSATITVRDAQGRSGTYNVGVSGVIQVLGLGNALYPNAVNAAASRGKRIPSLGELNEIYSAYRGRWPMGNAQYWSTTPGAGLHTARCLNLVTGGWADLNTKTFFGIGGSYANIVAI